MRCPVVGPFAPPRQVLSLQGRLRQVALIGIARSVKTVRSWFLWCGRFNFRWANSLFAQRISRRWRPWCNFRASRSWWRGGVWRLRLHLHCLGVAVRCGTRLGSRGHVRKQGMLAGFPHAGSADLRLKAAGPPLRVASWVHVASLVRHRRPRARGPASKHRSLSTMSHLAMVKRWTTQARISIKVRKGTKQDVSIQTTARTWVIHERPKVAGD